MNANTRNERGRQVAAPALSSRRMSPAAAHCVIVAGIVLAAAFAVLLPAAPAANGDVTAALPSGVVCGEDGVCRFVGPAQAESGGAAIRAGGVESMQMERSCMGALSPREFVDFLEGTDHPANAAGALARAHSRGGVLLLALALLGGGFLLNLSPCVLPLVPVNLALLGAGVTSGGSRRRGAANGFFYGAGIATAFGSLGLAAARGGAAFGAWHGSPWFHAALFALFAFFSAASADLVSFDLSGLRSRIRIGNPGGTSAGKPVGSRKMADAARAFALGAVAALLSGACVAPVLASTLVLAADFSAAGRPALGAALPFLLGIGMALPWPALGAGIAFLPRPGDWMPRLRRGYAFVFAALAIWQLVSMVRLALPERQERAGLTLGGGDGAATSRQIEWLVDETAAVATARALQAPLLLDLAADWCRECARFDAETLQNPEVVSAVDALGAIPLRIDCSDTSSPQVRRILEATGAPGLPFCAIFVP